MTKATRKSFNRGWVFQLDDSAAFAAPTLDDRAWRGVTLPHDWSAEEPLDEANPAGCGGGYAKAGIGWYRKHFDFTPEMAGKVVRITFDGVYMDTDIYLNEQRIGGCGYGYSSFYVDLSPALRDGDNVLAVRVNNSLQPNSRWYAGSGIYRNVWLEILENVHLAQWGIFAMTSQLYLDRQPTLAKLQINTNVDNDTDVRLHAEVFHTLQDANGKELFSTGTAIQLDMHTSGEVMTTPVVESPHLWTCDDPYLYTLHTVVRVNGAIVDAAQTRIGIRTATFDCDQGFLLSGKPVKIKGMCVHHDCGLTGAVGLRESWLRRLRLLKDMGCNGIRCAHNPPTPELLDLCDELGFFVMDEIFDEWMLTKDKIHNYYSQSLAYGSSQFFCRDAQKDLLTMLQRDRCHPSIVLWSIGNEIPEQATVEGVRLLHYLQDICHREDPTRMVISACDNIAAAAPSTAFCEFVNALDVVGYNYVARWRERAETLYDEDHKHFPQRRMIGSENPSAGGARGDYALQTGSASAFRNDYLRATMNHEFLWRYTMSRDFVAGDFLWTGIDYLGESEWPSKGSASGPIDTAGFPK
ncbi:MAG: glycoside hydrolase family 2 TIM barrel-domain containing protein, partial [Clostridia bacterium]